MDWADGFIVIYGVDNKSTFDKIPTFIRMILEAVDGENVPVVVVATKGRFCFCFFFFFWVKKI